MVLNSTQSTKNTVITAIKSCCIAGAVLSAKRSSGARPRCGSVAPRRDYVIDIWISVCERSMWGIS